MPYANIKEIRQAVAPAMEIADEKVSIKDERLIREKIIDRLVRTAVFGDSDSKEASNWLIWSLSQAFGCGSASIQGLYEAMGRGEVSGFTTAAINIRGLTYDVARTVFRAAKNLDSAAIIFEIARSEIGYTIQRPSEYSAAVLAAAIKEGWTLPVFLQGDHFQINLKRFLADPDGEIRALETLAEEAIKAGFFNIDVDSSTLVDLEKATLDEQQARNYEGCSAITRYVRGIEPEGITVSVGGEIGEVGGKNSTVEEFRAFMDGFMRKTSDVKGISKISVQTGTSHGGVPLADGTIADVKLDFGVLESISTVARQEYGISGAVQHGASTLPDEAFHRFPETGCSEIHLATGFQNIIYDHSSFPAELRDEIYAHLRDKCQADKKGNETDEQFIYKTRKKGFGPFKRALWDLDAETRKAIMGSLFDKFTFIFEKLGNKNTKEIIRRHVLPVPVTVKKPDSL